MWAAEGLIRTILDLTDNDYGRRLKKIIKLFKDPAESAPFIRYINLINEYKQKIKEKEPISKKLITRKTEITKEEEITKP